MVDVTLKFMMISKLLNGLSAVAKERIDILLAGSFINRFHLNFFPCFTLEGTTKEKCQLKRD